jgi:hypothetical protein
MDALFFTGKSLLFLKASKQFGSSMSSASFLVASGLNVA